MCTVCYCSRPWLHWHFLLSVVHLTAPINQQPPAPSITHHTLCVHHRPFSSLLLTSRPFSPVHTFFLFFWPLFFSVLKLFNLFSMHFFLLSFSSTCFFPSSCPFSSLPLPFFSSSGPFFPLLTLLVSSCSFYSLLLTLFFSSSCPFFPFFLSPSTPK